MPIQSKEIAKDVDQSLLYDTIMYRIRQDIGKPKSLDESVHIDLEAVQMNGSWKDVDYAGRSMTNWKPFDHLQKVQNLILAYITLNSRYYADEKLYQTIVSAFEFWQAKDPQSDNWWHNQIAAPQSLGVSLILMRDGKKPLPKALEDLLIQQMKRGDKLGKRSRSTRGQCHSSGYCCSVSQSVQQ